MVSLVCSLLRDEEAERFCNFSSHQAGERVFFFAREKTERERGVVLREKALSPEAHELDGIEEGALALGRLLAACSIRAGEAFSLTSMGKFG